MPLSGQQPLLDFCCCCCCLFTTQTVPTAIYSSSFSLHPGPESIQCLASASGSLYWVNSLWWVQMDITPIHFKGPGALLDVLTWDLCEWLTMGQHLAAWTMPCVSGTFCCQLALCRWWVQGRIISPHRKASTWHYWLRTHGGILPDWTAPMSKAQVSGILIVRDINPGGCSCGALLALLCNIYCWV